MHGNGDAPFAHETSTQPGLSSRSRWTSCTRPPAGDRSEKQQRRDHGAVAVGDDAAQDLGPVIRMPARALMRSAAVLTTGSADTRWAEQKFDRRGDGGTVT